MACWIASPPVPGRTKRSAASEIRFQFEAVSGSGESCGGEDLSGQRFEGFAFGAVADDKSIADVSFRAGGGAQARIQHIQPFARL